MKYTYAYKTSDGVRHEDSMNACSREEVFIELRKKGIKAIKVFAADGLKANGEVRGVRKRVVTFTAVGAAFLAGLLVYIMKPQQPTQAKAPTAQFEFTSESSRIAYTNLKAKAQAILSKHERSIEALELDALVDYQFLEKSKDTSFLRGKVKAGYKAVDVSRSETRSLFMSIFDIFPADCVVERTEAQRLYADTMDRLDISESRIANDEKAFKLLDSNRGKWHCENGKVNWNDATLAKEFEYFRRDISPSAIRWSKDFGTVESNIVEIPSAKK